MLRNITKENFIPMEKIYKDDEKAELFISILGTLFKGHPQRVMNINSHRWGPLYGEKPMFTDELELKLDIDFLKVSDAIASLVRDGHVDSVLEEIGFFDKVFGGKRPKPLWFITPEGKFYISSFPLMFAKVLGYPEKDKWDNNLIFEACCVYFASINDEYYQTETLAWVNKNILNEKYKVKIANLPKPKYKEDNEPTRELVKISDEICNYHQILLSNKFDNFRDNTDDIVPKNTISPKVTKLTDTKDLNLEAREILEYLKEAREIVEYLKTIAKNFYDKQTYENDIQKFFDYNFRDDEKHSLDTTHPYVFPDKYPLTIVFNLDDTQSINVTALETKDFGDIHLNINGPSYDDWFVDSDLLSEHEKGTLYEVLTIEKNVKDSAFEMPNQDSEEIEKKIKFLHEMIPETINMQFMLGGYSSSDKKPNNDFIVGYIIGYCDSFLVRNGINNNSPEGFSVPSIALISIFGKDEGPQLFNRFLNSQLNISKEMDDGRKTGYNDGFDWMDNKTRPTKLSRYLMDL